MPLVWTFATFVAAAGALLVACEAAMVPRAVKVRAQRTQRRAKTRR
jgi:hypothetical protein